MKKTKLVKILKTFSAAELRKFKDFVHSPYFNKNNKLKALLDFLLKYAPCFDQENFTEEEAFKSLFGSEDYKEQVITKLLSKLYKLIITFIHCESDEESRLPTDIHFLSFLKKRGLIRDYKQFLSQVDKRVGKSAMRDANHFYEQFLVKQEIAILGSLKGEHRTGDIDYQPAVNALDVFYLVQKLIYLCNQWNHHFTSPKQTYDFELLEEIESYIPQSPYFKIPTIQIWFNTFQLLKNDDKEEYYAQLKALVFKHYKELNTVDIRNLFSIIQNSARLIFKKKEDYYSELFELYNFQLEKGIFSDPVTLTPSIFLNIITTALLLNKRSWTSNFLETHKDYSINREDDIHSLCKAMLLFSKKEFSKALDILNKCQLKNIYFKLGERRLRLKVYLELQLFELIDDYINSFRKFLSKNQDIISDLHLNANRDFVNLTNQLFYLKKNDFQKINKLNTEIVRIPVLPERRWLVEKIEVFLIKT